MTSRHLVDPEIAPLLEMFPPLQLSNEVIPNVRQMLNAHSPELPPPVIEPRELRVPGVGSHEVPILVFDPPNRKNRAAILQIHGGGMVMGTAGSNTLSNAALAKALDILVVAVDYRLAPENPFPAPQNDCLAAYDWLILNAPSLGVEVGRLAVMGESAGGALAASLALMAGEAQGGLAHTGEFIWTRESNQYGWTALRGDYLCNDHRVGWFSPALASDLTNLPPTFIAAGALDLFLEEDLYYAQRLVAAGTPVELHVYPGGVHAFNLVQTAGIALQFDRDLKSALTKLLGL
jgi:acetyl esterase